MFGFFIRNKISKSYKFVHSNFELLALLFVVYCLTMPLKATTWHGRGSSVKKGGPVRV